MYFRRHARSDARLAVTSLLVFALCLDCVPALRRSVSANALPPPTPITASPNGKLDLELERTAQKRIAENFAQLPLSFELNQGQLDRQVSFFSRGNGYGIYLTPQETVMVLNKTVNATNKSSADADRARNN